MHTERMAVQTSPQPFKPTSRAGPGQEETGLTSDPSPSPPAGPSLQLLSKPQSDMTRGYWLMLAGCSKKLWSSEPEMMAGAGPVLQPEFDPQPTRFHGH